MDNHQSQTINDVRAAVRAAVRIQARARGMHVRQYILPLVEEDAWTNAQTIKMLMQRVQELETICTQQQATIADQGDKIAILDKIFKARQTKSAMHLQCTAHEEGFATYPLPPIGAPEE